MKRDTFDFWYGLTPDGKQIGVEHGAMIDWAMKHDCHISVGWSHDMTGGRRSREEEQGIALSVPGRVLGRP